MLETERLLIRKFTPDDLDALIEMRADPEVNKYLGGTRLQNPEAVAKRLKVYISCYDKFGFGACAAVWKETGEMAGWGGLMPLEDSGEVEVGYGFAKKFWGIGLASELAHAWLKYGFEQAGLERIVAVAIPGNDASTNVMKKLGMKYEKNAMHYGEDCVFYGISKEDFLRNR